MKTLFNYKSKVIKNQRGKIEFQGDTKALAEGINFEDMEVGAVLGFTEESLPRLKATTRGLLMAYKPIEDLAEEKGGTVEQMFDWLENGVEGSENDEYIAYERKRLENL